MTDDQADLVRRQTERWNDPQTHSGAQERMDRAMVQLQRLTPKVQSQLEGIERAAHFNQRIIWLREAVATAASAIAPHAACKAGCAGCCHQPVMISEAEAKLIARETGARLAQPPKWRRKAAMEFSGQPCPFLKDSRCSIYAQRPIACRQLFNLDVDALLCQIVPGSAAQVPYADLRQFNKFLIDAHDNLQEAAKVADLRDFFPKGLR